MFLWTCTLCLSFQLTLLTSQPSENTDEVVFVALIYRHGDRTPIDPYPNDPYNNNSLWPAPWGELTDIGKRGHYELGKWLRKRYDDLLPKKYNKSDIHVSSTDVDRTLMSALCNLAGLYEPDKNSNWNPNLLWSPIPVHTIPEKLDYILAAEKPCPKYDMEEEKLLESSTFHEINEKHKKLYEFLSVKTGRNVTSVKDVSNIYDVLFIEELYKFNLPDWSKNIYPEPLKELSEINFQVPCFTKAMARLKIGPLLNEIITNMEKKISGSLTEKAWMYSAHDTTVANFLQGLGLFEPHCPPYLSLILLELVKSNTQDYYVTISYKNSSIFPPLLLKLPGCEELCPFKQFKFLLSDLIPKDWTKECQEFRFIKDVLDAAASFSLIVTLAIVGVIFLTLIAVWKYYKNRRWSHSEFAYTILKMDVNS